MSYPSALKSMATRLSNYSSTLRKVVPQGKDGNYRAGDVARFILPSNTLVDLRSLALHFTGSTGASSGAGAVLFPQLTTSLIDQIVVSAGGVQIEGTPRGWGQLAKMIDDFTAGSEKRRTRSLLNNERMAGYEKTTGDFFKYAINTEADQVHVKSEMTPTLVPGVREINRRFVIDEWPGCFIGTVNPSIISTALTGDIMIEFRFAPNGVLVSQGVKGYKFTDDDYLPDASRMDIDGEDDVVIQQDYEATVAGDESVPVGPYYMLDKLHLSVKTIDISDGSFYDWLKGEISSEPLMLPFQHWVVQPGQSTKDGFADQTTRMTVNSSSVDYLLGTFIPTDYESGSVLPGETHIYNMPNKRPNTYPDSYARQGTYGNTATGRYFQRGGIDIRQGQNVKPFESSFAVNNVMLDYPADIETVWSKLKNDFNLGKTQATSVNPALQSLGHFAQGFFVASCRLNFNTGDADTSRYLSGLDCRNSTVNILWKTTGQFERLADGLGYQDAIPHLYAATTSILRVSPGRVLDLVM